MSAAKLVTLDDGLQLYVANRLEAQYLHDEIFRDRCYGQISLPPEALVIDAGANIGLFTIMVKLQFPEARVIAFEPMPDSAEILRKNVALHNLSRVKVKEVALGARPEASVPFMYYPLVSSNSTRYPAHREPAKAALRGVSSARIAERLYKGHLIEARVARLSSFLADGQPVGLLKIDVEGAEVDVLRGIDSRHWPLIDQVVAEVELGPDAADAGGGRQLADLCALLRGNGLEPSVGLAPAVGGPPVRMVRASRPGSPRRNCGIPALAVQPPASLGSGTAVTGQPAGDRARMPGPDAQII